MADRRRKKPAEDATAADLLKEELAERITAEDREAIGAALQEIQKSAAEAAGIAHAWREMGNSLADIYWAMQPEIEGLRDAAITAASAAIGITDFGKNLRDVVKDLFPAIFEIAREMAELEPYLQEELKKPEYEGKTFDDLLAELEEEGRKPSEGLPAGTLARKVWDAAKAAKAAAENVEPTRAAAKRAEAIEYPLDKPNSIIWRLLEKDTGGQIKFNMAKYGSRQQVPAFYAINFDDLGDDIQITKRLLPFDKRVYIAISALFNAGNNVISLTQIYFAMGNTSRPPSDALEKINDSITKMTTARIYFNNEQEAKKYKYPHFKYDGALLPIERGTAVVNGRLADAAIHIFREPPLISFAKQRRQITTIDIKLLQSPVNKTDANLQIDDYLIERISKGKNGKAKSCRILFKTLYDHAGIATKKQAQRAPGKIEKYLQHYQKEGFITRFTMEDDGTTVYW